LSRTFLHDVDVQIVLLDSDLVFMATIEFTCTPIIPATYDDPAEGGEVEIVSVVEIFIPAKATTYNAYGAIRNSATDRVNLECPKWLSDWIIANVDSDVLFNSLGSDAWDEDPDAAYDRARDDKMEKF
jgi:hypothetical protein